jgi:hypothetical protein
MYHYLAGTGNAVLKERAHFLHNGLGYEGKDLYGRFHHYYNENTTIREKIDR